VSGEILKRQNEDAAPAVAQINFAIQAAPLPDVPPVTNVTETGAGIGLSTPPAFRSTDTAAALAPGGHRQDGTPADSSAVTFEGTLMRSARDDDGSVGAPPLFPDGGQG
jgi:hypothetical protein